MDFCRPTENRDSVIRTQKPVRETETLVRDSKRLRAPDRFLRPVRVVPSSTSTHVSYGHDRLYRRIAIACSGNARTQEFAKGVVSSARAADAGVRGRRVERARSVFESIPRQRAVRYTRARTLAPPPTALPPAGVPANRVDDQSSRPRTSVSSCLCALSRACCCSRDGFRTCATCARAPTSVCDCALD